MKSIGTIRRELLHEASASIAEICSDKRVIRAPKSNGKVDSVTYISADDVHQMMSRRKVELLFELKNGLTAKSFRN